MSSTSFHFWLLFKMHLAPNILLQNEQLVCLYVSETTSTSTSTSEKRCHWHCDFLPCVTRAEHSLGCSDRYTFSYSYKLWLLPYMFNLSLVIFVYWILHGIPPRSLIISRNWPSFFFHSIFISGLNFQQHYPLWPISICYPSMTILGLSYL